MIDNIKHLEGLVSAGLETNEYVIINSAWLTLMGIRTNNDLDLILSSRLWKSQFSEAENQVNNGVADEVALVLPNIGAEEREVLQVHGYSTWLLWLPIGFFLLAS